MDDRFFACCYDAGTVHAYTTVQPVSATGSGRRDAGAPFCGSVGLICMNYIVQVTERKKKRTVRLETLFRLAVADDEFVPSAREKRKKKTSRMLFTGRLR